MSNNNNNRRPWRALIIITLALLAGAGCTMAPTYERPEMAVPNHYPAEKSQNLTAEAMPATWRDFFQDEGMRLVVETALENNRDLRVSLLNIEKTRAQYRIQRAELLPSISGSGGYSNQETPGFASAGGSSTITRQYSASLGFSSFELDIFGRVRSLTEQALENYLAVEENARSVRLSLVAESAAMYLQLVAEREQYDLALATAENRRKNYELVQRKFAAGVSSDLELSQAQSILDEARASLASSATALSQAENALCLLMGAPLPEAMPQARCLADVAPLPDLPAGLPSELLERRPDVVAAEHSLKAANANIGAARANFFPSISLTGNLGKISPDFSGLFEGGGRTWSFGPQIYLPIFEGGATVAAYEVSQKNRDIAVAQYEKTVQTAFREVADALAQRDNIGALLEAQQSLVSSSGKSYAHSSARYDAGVSAYINVLDAQRSLFSAQSALISTRLLRESNVLALYKALGGGWEM